MPPHSFFYPCNLWTDIERDSSGEKVVGEGALFMPQTKWYLKMRGNVE